MILDNLQVKHKAFGLGTVVATNGKYMIIHFDCGDKNFVYPDAFEKFLTLVDGTVSDEINNDICSANEHKKQINDKKHQENLHSMIHGIVIPGKEISQDNEEDESSDKGQNEEI